MKSVIKISALCWFLFTATSCSVDHYKTHVTVFYEQQLWTNAERPATADAKTRIEYGVEWTGKPHEQFPVHPPIGP